MLKSRLQSSTPLLVPGVFDALSAHVAARAGFEALYLSGFAVAGSLLARPDIGLVTASEMVERARQVVGAANGVPLIADGDNGHGGEHNVTRLVMAYEQAGVAAIQLEDQVIPKRCGHMEHKEVVPLDEAVSKIRAAVAARHDPEFLVIARTDARATHDLAEALRRGDAFLEAGADVLFIEAPANLAELQEIGRHFSHVPLVANLVEEGKTPECTLEVLGELGFSILLRPVTALLAVTHQLEVTYAALKQHQSLPGELRKTFQAYNNLVGLQDYLP